MIGEYKVRTSSPADIVHYRFKGIRKCDQIKLMS